MARLLFYRGPLRPGDPPLFVYRLRQTRTRIGRVDDCDVVLPDDSVSRSHCLIDQRSEGFVVIDRSSNGTWRNGERISTAVLADRDQLRIGSFVAVVDAGGALEAPPTERPQPEQRDEELIGSGEELAVNEAWLVITDGPGLGERRRLRGGRLGVGGAGSKVVLPDGSLLKDHVRVRLNHGRTMVEPGEGAAFLGNHRVRDTMPIYPGEEVRVGTVTFTVTWDARLEFPVADKFGDMVGTSETMHRAFGLLRRMAAHHAPVLLLGESGTGKELAARGVHDASPRASGPFVALNCGAITASLFESELFGHEKGAFTGATERRDGAFQRANGGTLFLDEVGELPDEAQSKLLRALESGEVRRVGGAEAMFPDVRVVAATNRNLAAMAQRGGFRADLYFRLAVLTVRLPPLRERREDIPGLASTLAQRIHGGLVITPEAMEVLVNHAWPGNARELRNVLTRAFVLGGPTVLADSLVFNPLEGPAPTETRTTPSARSIVEEAEREVVVDALRRSSGNRTHAAKLLGIPRSTLLYKLKRWGMEEEE